MTNIIRKQNGSFTVVRNALVNDERLSLEAIGLLTWLLSKPDNWRVIQSHISATFKIGKNKTYSLLRELIDCGYLVRGSVRSEKGEFVGVDYILYDTPPETQETRENIEVSPRPCLREPVNPRPVNPPLVNTNSKQELRSSLGASVEAEKKVKGMRVPEDFTPDESCMRLARELCIHGIAFQAQLDAFMDYWRAVPGAKGRKLDWQGTFRNWLRNSKSFNRGKSNAAHSSQSSRDDIFAAVDARLDEAERQLDEVGQGYG